MAAKNANADEAFTIGQSAVAEAISGNNSADMKLKRKETVVSIYVSHNAEVVRGQEVELNPTLLFIKRTCVIIVQKWQKIVSSNSASSPQHCLKRALCVRM